MTPEAAHLLADRLAEYDIDVEVREDYSGRGMYGKTTAGLVISGTNNIAVLMAIGWCAYELTEGGEDGLELSDLPNGTDSMGLDTIVY